MESPVTLVIIPIHNEAASLETVISGLLTYPELEILVVDDASTDSSLQVARSLGVRVLPLCLRLGAWGAIQAGLRYAEMHEYQFAITMDGDGQHHSCEIASLFQGIEGSRGADVVIGACPSRGSSMRKIAWRFFRLLTGFSIADLTSGFRLYSRRSINALTCDKATLLEYQDIGVLLLLRSEGLEIVEKPVSMQQREHGHSRVYSSWFKVAYYMFLTTVLSISKIKRTSSAPISS